jgi:hypothetical protein
VSGKKNKKKQRHIRGTQLKSRKVETRKSFTLPLIILEILEFVIEEFLNIFFWDLAK